MIETTFIPQAVVMRTRERNGKEIPHLETVPYMYFKLLGRSENVHEAFFSFFF